MEQQLKRNAFGPWPGAIFYPMLAFFLLMPVLKGYAPVFLKLGFIWPGRPESLKADLALVLLNPLFVHGLILGFGSDSPTQGILRAIRIPAAGFIVLAGLAVLSAMLGGGDMSGFGFVILGWVVVPCFGFPAVGAFVGAFANRFYRTTRLGRTA